MISVRFQDKLINVTVIQLGKEVCNIVQNEVIKIVPKKKKCKGKMVVSGGFQIAEKRREAKVMEIYPSESRVPKNNKER